MKKPRIPLLAAVTLVFAAFILGFFAGRNTDRTPVQIQMLPAATSPVAEAASAAATHPAEEAPPETDVPETEVLETQPQWPLDINTATLEQLQTLPGIGPVLAQRILDYREAEGAFQSVGELIKVSGIGEKKLEAIWDLVTIGGQ